MASQRTVKWHQVDKEILGLETDIEHQIHVQREAIPLIFVPGIMGSRLRAAGTNGTGDANGLPNMRWDPSSAGFMVSKYYGTAGSVRKRMLVGDRFSSSYLEVHNANPIGNGFQGIHDDYLKFLTPLANWNWTPLNKIFDFPVYAVGYNWTDSNENSGKILAGRIQDIIAEAAKVTGQCEKVILLTHSMGGLVARWASQQAGAKDSILGIIHCVQPVTGASAAYWRMKAGFEGSMVPSGVLGDSAYTVTPILGSIPGGLQLLPNKLYVANDGSKAWLRATSKVGSGGALFSLPNSNPYDDIYRVKVTVTTSDPKPTVSQWWGLVDPGLLDPRPNTGSPGLDLPEDSNDSLNAQRATSAWTEYLRVLKIAEDFHDTLGKDAHPVTFCIRGTGKPSGTCDVIRFVVDTNWIQTVVYSNQGFRGLFEDSSGKDMQAVLQDPDGAGDGTVPSASAGTLNAPGKPSPGDADFAVEHQPAYQDEDVQAFAVKAILALVKKRYDSLRVGDSPAPSTTTATG